MKTSLLRIQSYLATSSYLEGMWEWINLNAFISSIKRTQYK